MYQDQKIIIICNAFLECLSVETKKKSEIEA